MAGPFHVRRRIGVCAGIPCTTKGRLHFAALLLFLLAFLLPLQGICGPVVQPGIDPKALGRLMEKVQGSQSDALMIVKDGKTVLEWRSRDGGGLMESMSITKSVTGLAMGRLIDTGRIKSIDEPVCRFFPEWDHGEKRFVTIRHLLNHTSGLRDRVQPFEKVPDNPDFVRLALDSELTSVPGSRFAYNNTAVNLLSGIVRVVTGKRLDEFVGAEIFAPLGIKDYSWTLDGGGNALAMIGLHIAAPDLVRIGQMMLNRGTWKGRRIVSEKWINLTLSPAQPFNPESGLLWWIMPRPSTGFYARGHLGQYLVVIPAHKLVAVLQVRVSARDGEDLKDFPAMVEALAP